jgi:diphthine-ammonia ligase
MKVCCLVSGGKDSTYAALLAERHGHTLVALANLFQVRCLSFLTNKSEGNELDSWMYQTVATDTVLAYSECMGLPLYRLQIPDQLKIAESGLQYHHSAAEVNEVRRAHLLPTNSRLKFSIHFYTE